MKKTLTSIGLAGLLLIVPQVASAEKPSWAGKGKPSKVDKENWKKQKEEDREYRKYREERDREYRKYMEERDRKERKYYEERERDDRDKKKHHYKKEKHLPYGWEKKIRKGEVLDEDVIRNARVIDDKKYPKSPESEIYEIENKVFRVMKATREILEVIKD